MSTVTYCPNLDHDGGLAPVERHVEAVHPDGPNVSPLLTYSLCAYCSEGRVAVLVREGYRVTVWAIEPSPDEPCCRLWNTAQGVEVHEHGCPAGQAVGA